MKMEVPQVDLPLEVLAWTKVIVPATGVYFRHLYGRHNESLHQSAGI